jgi:glutamine amidotransferase
MSTVAVIDYGMGNLHSVAKALERVAPAGTRVVVTADAALIRGADRVVFPGVGAIRDCIGELKRLSLDEVVREQARGKPLLCVCVGMQALMDFSAENDGTECLGIVPGRVEFFGNDLRDPLSGERLKVPHMGWNEVHQEGAHPLWRDIAQDARFYFVHSYYTRPVDARVTAATTRYGATFTSAIARDNVFAVQFHPEKSAQSGLQLYANFLRWDGTT